MLKYNVLSKKQFLCVLNFLILLFLTSQHLFAATNTNFFGSVVISANTSWDEAVYFAENLIVSNGATLTIAGGSELNVTNDVYVLDSSKIICESKNKETTNAFGNWDGEGVAISASNVTVETSASINADGTGYRCLGDNYVGSGPGGGGTSGDAGGGGGYGGKGGDGHNESSFGGAEYGDSLMPTGLGSAGGGGDYASSPYGHGGGAIKLQVENSLHLDGAISASGAWVGGHSGGGAGGSLWIDIGGQLSGSGAIYANGGQAGNSSGGGAGGRIVVYFNTIDASFNLTNCTVGGGPTGGNGGQPGEEGTIGFFKTENTYMDFLTFHKFYFQESLTTTFNSISVYNGGQLIFSPGSLINVEGSVLVTNGAQLNFGGGGSLNIKHNLSVYSNSTMVCESYNNSYTNDTGEWVGEGVSICASNVLIAGEASINADGTGYRCLGINLVGSGPGGGGTSSDAGGGGGYGGKGGSGHNESSFGGMVYGEPETPTELGSAGGGGDYDATPYGYGGGAIKLQVEDSLILDGRISANGAGVGGHSGGGSGGSVFVIVNNLLTGSGSFSANGGWAGNSSGGGGGGRIAVHCDNVIDFNGITNSTAYGGAGGENGGNPGEAGAINFFDEPWICITTAYDSVSYTTTDYVIAGTNYGVVGVMTISNSLSQSVSNFPAASDWEINMQLLIGSNSFYVSGTNVFGQSTNDVVCIHRKTWSESIPQIATNALVFPASNSVIWASYPTNIIWDVSKITDDVDGTNLTISRVTLHYAETTNFILEVTNNIVNGLGEFEWYVPAGNWSDNTNYVLKFEVVDSSSLTNSRIFWNNEFIIVPEPIKIWIVGLLGFWIVVKRQNARSLYCG